MTEETGASFLQKPLKKQPIATPAPESLELGVMPWVGAAPVSHVLSPGFLAILPFQALSCPRPPFSVLLVSRGAVAWLPSLSKQPVPAGLVPPCPHPAALASSLQGPGDTEGSQSHPVAVSLFPVLQYLFCAGPSQVL